MPSRFGWIVGLVVIAGGLVAAVFVRGAGLTALGAPWPMEAAAARSAWRFLVPRAAASAVNPVPNTPDVLHEALEHWADHCASCHGNDGRGDTTIGRRIYPRAPDMRADRTQRLSDGELFYAIENGVPWTGMPGWSTGLPDGEHASWALVRFIRHLPTLTAAELQQMERFTPRSAADDDRDHEIDDFLRGNDTPSQTKGTVR